MESLDLENVREEVITFMNSFVLAAGLPLQVSRIDDDVYRKLQLYKSAEIEWDWAIQYLNKNSHFDLAIGIQLDDDIDGLAIGIYQKDNEVLEIQAVESFVRFKDEHPLRGRMVELTIIAATYFVILVSGKGVHLIDPLDDKLITYYETFGFVLDSSYDETLIRRMVSDLDTLIARFEEILASYGITH